MRTFQLVIAVVTAFMMLGMFGFNMWINNKFSVSGVAQCYMPMNVITTMLVLITIITILIRK
jgi:hypothetical protein